MGTRPEQWGERRQGGGCLTTASAIRLSVSIGLGQPGATSLIVVVPRGRTATFVVYSRVVDIVFTYFLFFPPRISFGSPPPASVLSFLSRLLFADGTLRQFPTETRADRSVVCRSQQRTRRRIRWFPTCCVIEDRSQGSRDTHAPRVSRSTHGVKSAARRTHATESSPPVPPSEVIALCTEVDGVSK